MKNLTSYIFHPKSNSGFSLIELIVALTITAFLFSGLIVNINGQRAPRDIKIAQNELVSNIRKAESYTLSARNLPSGVPAQYYVVKFDLSKPTQYVIQAIYNVSSSPKVLDLETIKLPSNVKITAINVTQRLLAPATQTLNTSTACALAAFVAPYGKVIFNSGCDPVSFTGSYIIQSTDDYQKLVNFQTNVQCGDNVNPPPATCTASTDSIFTITLTNTAKASLQKQVIINGVTGGVSFD